MRTNGRVGSAIASLLLVAAAAGCGRTPDDERVGNLRPHVRVTGGPIEDNRENYHTRVYWTGWDDDGVIVRYEYAVDPPDAFTASEISAPEVFDGLTVTSIQGTQENRDTLLVSKVVDDVVHSFKYIQTLETDHRFLLSATHAESISVGGQKVPRGTSQDFHRIYLRALDNENAYSDAARLAFNAFTYAPSATIVFPNMKNREFLITGGRISINWFGIDPDPPQGASQPKGFLWKLVDLKSLDPPLSIFQLLDPQDVMFRRAASIPWAYLPVDTPGVTLFMEPSEYLFGVRAVDMVGAEEPFMEFRRDDQPGNAIRFMVTSTGGRPEIVLHEPTLGSFTYRGHSQLQSVEVPTGIDLRFAWSASAQAYGGRIEAYSYGLDIAELDAEGPRSGWSPWGVNAVRTQDPIRFKTPGYHVFNVRVRDSAGTIQVASLGITAFDITLNREVLMVDDYRSGWSFFTDTKHDAFWNSLLQNSGRFDSESLGSGLWYETGGDRDRFMLDNKPPPLSLIGQYRTTIWVLHGDGWCGKTGFFQAAVTSSTIRSYLAAGGQLWITGMLPISATLRGTDCNDPMRPFYDPRQPTFPAADTNYPLAFGPGDFAYDVMRIASGRVMNDKNDRWENTLVAVDAWNPDRPILPAMQVDPGKYPSGFWENQALSHVDAVFDPIDLSTHPYPGDLDSLYAYVAANEVRKLNRNDLQVSPYRDRLCALRWHDPDPAPRQGRIMWFGFPLYFMQDIQAQETFNRAIDWFREEGRPAPAKPGQPLSRVGDR